MPTVQWTAVVLLAVAWLALWPGTGAADPATDDAAAAQLDPDYAAGKQAIDAKEWSTAITALTSASATRLPSTSACARKRQTRPRCRIFCTR